MERKVKFSYDFKLCCVQEVLRDNCSLGFVARQEGYNAKHIWQSELFG